MAKVLREPNDHGTSKPEVLELTDSLAMTIARFNGRLNANQVKDYILAGLPVHTSFCIYSLVREGE